ncbi:hypothetical protein A3I46_01200 [Candidatus Kaiserbacteria bacterium RIFCSPLOWO2_02_FULL_54_13]|uniref:Uncharacterized protein n=1 Tax=Candidatus Kaiserbacteria bacterium RIFCSPHIGHO2_02_FULL_54_22 TaxID=1798495 RepID=A0A1F6DJE5_9BACT|nr:MAG: hypothetical protein A3C19_01705 [Candidatus Kaiserbacteria bacterium RIFCSPHIGHO2_02_FULL_54_22]OGG68553.1 MAG: hypothetical protein A3E99_00215 [Candidatus Kaiserbacteria bacterium RIFCSPHIGHO2_12_FULL_54_16]OGG83952.1 MAG: hypothetical protein A3I46_01200 [Candidatus Kaiserbacteria bacterium RIFCSPLOWO2_02_FULL_54_13]OGG89919.1 MAG: hypothetical protein A3G12_01600 [Candidatus Kaiserbacteria bacterium RIFCSPLOWO2_12_FULL_54_10]
MGDYRFLLALLMCQTARAYGYPVIVVDGSPDHARACELLFAAGATQVIQQTEPGTGASRRQCIKACLDAIQTANLLDIAGFAHAHGEFSDIQVIAWIEPEKVGMVAVLAPCIAMIVAGYDIIIPWRNHFFAPNQYPPYQALSEARANAEMAEITGLNLDWMIGPHIMSRRAAELMMSYRGQSRIDPNVKYDDNWGILFIPMLWALQDGMKVGSCPVDYAHPAIQAAIEVGEKWDEKRDVQRTALVAAMRQEAELIGLKRAAA